MIIRYKIWKARGIARAISKKSPLEIYAQVDGITVGKFRRGRELKL